MRATIIRQRYGVYTVIAEGQTLVCSARGILRYQGRKPCVGDHVEVDPAARALETLLPRHNQLIRPAIANVDQAIIVHSLVEPDYAPFLIDKFLTYAKGAGIPPVILLTKIDRVDDRTLVDREAAYYRSLGIPVILFSKRTLEGLDDVRRILAHKTSVLMGQTGVGKSSLLNALSPALKREEGSYSEALGRGRHATKEVVLLPLADGLVADTPGFSSLELPLTQKDAAMLFPGYEAYAVGCKFADCLHLEEKECKVKNALKQGKLSMDHYAHYKRLLAELPIRKERF